MKRALWAIFGVLLIALVSYYVMRHPNLDKIEHLRGELAKLQQENDKLAKENADLEEQIAALRDDPRLAERRARESAGLVRPGEVIYQFEEPDTPIRVDVKLVVRNGSLELAGKRVAMDELSSALIELKRQVPGAQLDVVMEDDVDPVRRQRVLDLVEASPTD